MGYYEGTLQEFIGGIYMCDKCAMCGKATNRYSYYADVVYDEEYGDYLCGKCSNDHADSVEDYEERKRDRLAREQEY